MLNQERRGGKNLFLHPNRPGRRINSPLFGVEIISLNPKSSDFKCAVVVSKKISTRAPIRNLIKRRLYSAIRELNAMIKPGLGIIIFAKPPLLNVSYSDIVTELTKILTNA